jgi:hypothetical protein
VVSFRDAYFAMAVQHPVVAIDNHLLTTEQRRFLLESRLTVADVLAGRYPLSIAADVQRLLFTAWNDALDGHYFTANEPAFQLARTAAGGSDR